MSRLISALPGIAGRNCPTGFEVSTNPALVEDHEELKRLKSVERPRIVEAI
ncbi:MAG: hypothetical protein HQL83_15570, partial [Magnetococcales bacterium]|nr:hypothetical protein [Magnetococcales bacterium]